jgi:hypothetical protein
MFISGTPPVKQYDEPPTPMKFVITGSCGKQMRCTLASDEKERCMVLVWEQAQAN